MNTETIQYSIVHYFGGSGSGNIDGSGHFVGGKIIVVDSNFGSSCRPFFGGSMDVLKSRNERDYNQYE